MLKASSKRLEAALENFDWDKFLRVTNTGEFDIIDPWGSYNTIYHPFCTTGEPHIAYTGDPAVLIT